MEEKHHILSGITENLGNYMAHVQKTKEGVTYMDAHTFVVCIFFLYTYLFNTLALYIGHPAGLLHPFPFPIEIKALQPSTYCMDGHVNHHEQVQRRLKFINFIVHNSDVLLQRETALMVWNSLIKTPVFPFDQEAGFKWFSQVCSL